MIALPPPPNGVPPLTGFPPNGVQGPAANGAQVTWWEADPRQVLDHWVLDSLPTVLATGTFAEIVLVFL